MDVWKKDWFLCALELYNTKALLAFVLLPLSEPLGFHAKTKLKKTMIWYDSQVSPLKRVLLCSWSESFDFDTCVLLANRRWKQVVMSGFCTVQIQE